MIYFFERKKKRYKFKVCNCFINPTKMQFCKYCYSHHRFRRTPPALSEIGPSPIFLTNWVDHLISSSFPETLKQFSRFILPLKRRRRTHYPMHQWVRHRLTKRYSFSLSPQPILTFYPNNIMKGPFQKDGLSFSWCFQVAPTPFR
jgi:hypothetical protein